VRAGLASLSVQENHAIAKMTARRAL